MCSSIFLFSDLHIFLHKKRIIRMTATAIEVLLTLIRFIMTYKAQRVCGDGVRSRISHMKTSTRLSYVFYRDGTLLLIPWVQTGCYWSNWLYIDSVSWVSLDLKTTGLELILFEALSSIGAAPLQSFPLVIFVIVTWYVVIVGGLSLTDPNY